MKTALALAFLALTGCATSRPTAPLRDLAAAGSETELSALLLLEVDRQMYESFTVRKALAGGPGLRETLANALGRIPDRRGRGPLEGLLLDEVPAVRRAAAFALGELEDPDAVAALEKALADPDRETGTLAAEALGKLKVPIVEVLQPMLPLPEEERWARLLPALFRFHEENAVKVAERGLARPERDLHAWAAYALARDPFPVAAPLLRPLLADPDPQVRAWAARALGLVGGEGDAERLVPLLADAEPGPIVQALKSAKALILTKGEPAPGAAKPRLLELLRDLRPGVRVTALEAAAAWLPDARLSEALIAFASGGQGRERGTALVALATAKSDARSLPLIEAAATSSDADVRSRAAEAAVLLAAGDLVERLAADPSPEVRQAALAARLPGGGAAAVAATAIADRDEAVRAAGLDWLAEHQEEARKIPFDSYREALTAALAAPSVESGLAAVRAALALAEAEPLVRGGLVAWLESAAARGDYPVRREAGMALGKLGQPVPELAPAGAVRPLRAYLEIRRQTDRPRTVEVTTNRGTFRIRLACPEAPLTCLNFLQLAHQGYFDGLPFHRVVPDFVVQGGDPRGDGFGGPGYTLRDEINRLRYRRGAVGMALAGPDTGGSQFFVALSPQPHLDGGYTVFGEVATGLSVVDQLVADDKIVRVVEVEGRP